ncbi:hypothetical protein AB1Y20_023686 [Prymnesium parvum]|uniref:COMM domain-containing protein n=1 Tax=Prymnesium parvum TaxID=97485 RepID=A0AB34JHL5_PRYPA
MASPSVFSALSLLNLLDESLHEHFLEAVASQLALSTTTAELESRFLLPFSEEQSEAHALLTAARALLHRVVGRHYPHGGREALLADLTAAGVSHATADWVCRTGAKAAQPLAADIRRGQVHAVSALSAAYLHDFDWQLNYVLSSNELAIVHEPALALQLQTEDVGQSGSPGEIISIELKLEELDSMLEALAKANEALRSQPSPVEAAA